MIIEFLGLALWVWWLVIAVVLFILELLTLGFLMACFALGALLASIVAGLDLGLSWQFASFALGSLASLILLRPFFARHSNRGQVTTGMDALIGRKLELTSSITPTQYGEVVLDGDVWRAVSVDGNLEAGELVEVIGYDSLILHLRRH